MSAGVGQFIHRRANRAFAVIFFALILSGCEGVVRGNGKVVSAVDQSPLVGVIVSWRGTETQTDFSGNFDIGGIVGCLTGCPELELIFTKPGFETKYVNLSKKYQGQIPIDGGVVELIPSSRAQPDLKNDRLGTVLYYISMGFAASALITLIALFFTDVNRKWPWFFAVLFGTAGIHYNDLADITNYKALNLAIQVNLPHQSDAAWYKLNVPLGVIVFWIYYFKYRSKRISKHMSFKEHTTQHSKPNT